MDSFVDSWRRLGLVAAALSSFAGCSAGGPRADPVAAPRVEAAVVEGEHDGEIVARLVEAHNREREKADLPPLSVDPRLEEAARRHALDMAARSRMSHKGSDGSSPFQRMEKQGYHFRRAAENVAAGASTVDSVMEGWMKSPPHRRNILGPYTQIGASLATDSDGLSYWCVTFGDPS